MVAERSRLREGLMLFEHFTLSRLLHDHLWDITALLASAVVGLSGFLYVASLYEKDPIQG